MIQALQNREIDMIFYAGRNPYFAEENGYALTNTAWTYSLMAVTDEKKFDENKVYTVAVPKEKYALKQHIAFSYPEWKLVDCDSLDDAADMVIHEKADCFLMGASQAMIYDNNRDFKSIPLTKTMEACFAVRGGERTLLSILNKTLKAMPSDMLTSALAIYDSTADKVTFYDFVKDNMFAFSGTAGFCTLSIIGMILVLLRKARKAEAVAKLAANDTQKLNDKLEAALKKAENASLAKTNFLNNMSHDIRTPMNVILGYNQLMKKELTDAKLLDYQKKIEQSGKLLLSIINNVLDMARIESGKMEMDENVERLGDILEEIDGVFASVAKEKNIQFQSEMDVIHKNVVCDGTKVREIVINLVSNALKYTPDGGTVTIKVKELPGDKEGYVKIKTEVADTGIGMSKDYIPIIFDSFSRERNTTIGKIGGTGLGMSIVKRLVDMMGGTIEVNSEPGKGSCFTVILQHRLADDSCCDKKSSPKQVVSKKVLKGKRILLTEDNDLNAEITTTVLEKEGVLIDRAADGVQCVEKMDQMPVGTYDLILMDIQMPNMDGYQATKRIRQFADKEKADIPIIAMTANAFEEDKRNALAAGMNAHMAKPVHVDELLLPLAESIGAQERYEDY